MVCGRRVRQAGDQSHCCRRCSLQPPSRRTGKRFVLVHILFLPCVVPSICHETQVPRRSQGAICGSHGPSRSQRRKSHAAKTFGAAGSRMRANPPLKRCKFTSSSRAFLPRTPRGPCTSPKRPLRRYAPESAVSGQKAAVAKTAASSPALCRSGCNNPLPPNVPPPFLAVAPPPHSLAGPEFHSSASKPFDTMFVDTHRNHPAPQHSRHHVARMCRAKYVCTSRKTIASARLRTRELS